ncbi:MAG: hypothetical protein H7338_24945 [Candidatus Sericytochromatia bacterium]|nr:hypothetical protein [Candidatus Sericytochromatia bacterium]
MSANQSATPAARENLRLALKRRRYYMHMLVLGIGGAVYTCLALFFNQAVGPLCFEGRLWDSSFIGLMVMVFMTIPIMLVYTGVIARWSSWQLWDLTWRWLLGMLALWLLSRAIGPVHILVFLPYYAAFAWLLTPKPVLDPLRSGTVIRPVATAPTATIVSGPQRPAVRRGPVPGQVSEFGRIPLETADLFAACVKQVHRVVSFMVPGDSPAAVRQATAYALLTAILVRWRQVPLTAPLAAVDLDFCRDCIRLALDIAGPKLDAEGQAVYRSVLTGLLAAWQKHHI